MPLGIIEVEHRATVLSSLCKLTHPTVVTAGSHVAGATHEVLLILAHQFWFSGVRISSKENSIIDAISALGRIFLWVINHKLSSTIRKVMHLSARTRPASGLDLPRRFHA
jgi:hypothetical protein